MKSDLKQPPRSPLPAILRAGLLAVAFSLTTPLVAEPAAKAVVPEGPDFEAVLSLPDVGNPRMAPDGRAVAYTVTATDWDDNRYDTEIWLAPQDSGPYQLTRTQGEGSSQPRWSPDSRWIAFLADRGAESQIHLIRPGGGEARPLTAIEGGVNDFAWSPDGRWMALALAEPASADETKRQELYGQFAVEDAEHRMNHLWLLDVAAARDSRQGIEKPETDSGDKDEDQEEGTDDEPTPVSGNSEAAAPPLRRLTEGANFTIDDFAWSPDSRRIAFGHRPRPTIPAFDDSDLSVVEVASGEVRPVVERPAFDGSPMWSPDGAWILFNTANGASAYYRNNELAKVPAGGGEIQTLTTAFDGNPNAIAWLDDGIRFLAFRKTRRMLFQLDPATSRVQPVDSPLPIIWEAHYSHDGRQAAFAADHPDQLSEIYRSTLGETPRQLTSISEAIAEWPLGSSEVIEWASRDDTPIEGVLYRPPGFDPGRRYPLLVIIHGGPAAVSLPRSVHTYVYPVQQWLAKGAVILQPNYRGSTGYGEAFRAKNVRNLGVGDAWDVLSGVDHLVDIGLADPDRLGAMGWSQGGYISAFITTTSDRFKAISVGAGISNWMTYYVNTDIHPFTRHYLQATPWEDPEIYAKTSPMTTINDAMTPTLIQHGENDRRVPIPNAYELFQGLQDVGVDTRLIVYKDFGHGIRRPKERLAAVWHNWQWFAKYIWGEEVELPLD
ncbi:MAG: S9 family peptidase [Acidobacteriota bacterium]